MRRVLGLIAVVALLTPLGAHEAAADPAAYGKDVALASAGATATSSGREVPYALGPELGIDGVFDNDSSRWSGEAADNGWFQVELAQPATIDHVAIEWSTSCPAQYKLQVSDDGAKWTDATAVRTPTCRSWDTAVLNLGQPYRYVRMQGIKRTLSYGYSINEFQVWDGPAPPASQVTTGAVSDLTPTSATLHGHVVPAGAGTSYQFQWGPAGSGPWGTGASPATDVGADPADVSTMLTGLTPGTTYLYRLATRTGDAPAYGAELTFTTPSPPPVAVPNDITPTPASMTQPAAATPFVLRPWTRIVARGQAVPIANVLAERLRRATGYPIAVSHGGTGIEILVDRHVTVSGFAGNPEAYALDVSASGIRIESPTAAGAFYGVQSLRQLFPAFVESNRPTHTTWTVPAVHIADGPRYGYRGVMLDLARNFLSVKEIERYLDQLAYLKLNVVHLHLSDDQGWRIQITDAGRAPGDTIDYNRLTEVSGATAIDEGGTDNLPGQTGFLTQKQYRQIIAYAAARYISVIPEIDLPGHSSSMLHAIPQLNTAHSVPQPPPGQDTIPADTSQRVGQSSLDTHAEVTYTFLQHVFSQLAAMTPGRYLGVGGDESYSTSGPDFDYFTTRVIAMVHDLGKSTTGWNLSYANETASLGKDDIVQFYNGSDAATATDATTKGTGVVVSFYPYTYLDYPYSTSDVDQFYNWDPPATVPDVPNTAIRGVEDPLWTETLRSDAEAEYQTWPRAAATAEVAWSPKADQDYAQFSARLAQLGDRWTLQGTNFHASPRVPWTVAAAGTDQLVWHAGQTLDVGTVLAPGAAPNTVSATIDWGDGSAPTPAELTLTRPADNTHVNGAYRVSGEHRYPHWGIYVARIHATAPNGAADAAFTLVAAG